MKSMKMMADMKSRVIIFAITPHINIIFSAPRLYLFFRQSRMRYRDDIIRLEVMNNKGKNGANILQFPVGKTIDQI